MHSLLSYPAVNAFLAPFLAALFTAELLQRLRLSGLAIIAGFSITVFLLYGFSYTTLTGSQKIVWLAIASALIAIPLSLTNWSLWRPVLTLLAAFSAVWVLQRVLLQHPTAVALQWGLSSALFTGWLVYWLDDLQDYPVRAGSAALALGLGTGAALLIAGSTLLGKYNLAMGSAALAYLFIMIASNSHLSCGRTFTLPVALISGLSGCLAVLTTKLPWYSLAALAVIPLAAKLPVSDQSPVWVQSTLLSVAALICAMAAVYLSWNIHGWAAF